MDHSVHRMPWFVVQTRPNRLDLAERNLSRQGFATFSPKQAYTQRHRGKFITLYRPLFPNYVFVAFDPAKDPFRVINSTYGVARLVSFGTGEPTRVPSALIRALMARCDLQGKLLPPDDLVEGQKLQVLRGPFAEYVVTIDSLAPQQRVWVLLDIMGRETRVCLDSKDLQYDENYGVPSAA